MPRCVQQRGFFVGMRLSQKKSNGELCIKFGVVAADWLVML
jgi:hypothetical protein